MISAGQRKTAHRINCAKQKENVHDLQNVFTLLIVTIHLIKTHQFWAILNQYVGPDAGTLN